MKVAEYFKKNAPPLISFEVIPQARGRDIAGLFPVIKTLVRYEPPFIDVVRKL